MLAQVLRIGTHPAGFKPPTPRAVVESFIATCLSAPAAVCLRAEGQHWGLFRSLCTRADCRGNLVQDAYLAALALEHNVAFVTTDRDYSRFPRLRWRHPLDDAAERINPG